MLEELLNSITTMSVQKYATITFQFFSNVVKKVILYLT